MLNTKLVQRAKKHLFKYDKNLTSLKVTEALQNKVHVLPPEIILTYALVCYLNLECSTAQKETAT